MRGRHASQINRRRFLGGLTVEGTAALLGLHSKPIAAEPPPELTAIRLVKIAGLRIAPQSVAEELFQGEGVTDVRYVETAPGTKAVKAVTSSEVNRSLTFAGPLISRLDAEDPIVLLADVHTGCLELFGNDRVRAICDLKGKTVAAPDLGGSEHVFLASMQAYVGLDPRQDVTWVPHPHAEGARLLAAGKVDALMAIPPEAQALRAKQIGHVVVNTMMDRS